MSESDVQRMAAHQEIATRNSRAAVNFTEETRTLVFKRMDETDARVNVLMQKLTQLEQKYNLLLSKNFGGGSTSGE